MVGGSCRGGMWWVGNEGVGWVLKIHEWFQGDVYEWGKVS